MNRLFYTSYCPHLLALLLLLTSALATTAQIFTDRPNQSESGLSMYRGDLQIESGAQVTLTGDSHSYRQWIIPSALFRYGLSDGVELRLLTQYESDHLDSGRIQGMRDLEIGCKIRLKRSENFSMVLYNHVILPTGTAELSSDAWGIRTKLCADQLLTSDQALSYNLGYEYLGSGSGNLLYTLSYGKQVNEKVGIFAEAFGQLEDMADHILSFDFGLVVATTPHGQLDLGVGIGATHRMNYLTAGYSWLIQSGSAE